MFKKIGVAIVACGVMLGIAGTSDAAVIPVRANSRVMVQRTNVHPHRVTVHRGVRRVHKHRVMGVSNTSINKTNLQAGRWNRGFHRHNFNFRRMV